MFTPQVPFSAEEGTDAFSHLMNNTNQRVLFYNLSTVAEKQLGYYRKLCCYLLIGFGILCCFLLYLFLNHQQEMQSVNPILETIEHNVVDNLRGKYKTLRKQSWYSAFAKPSKTPSEIMEAKQIIPSSTPEDVSRPVVAVDQPIILPVAMRQLNHDGTQMKEHKKQRKGAFAK